MIGGLGSCNPTGSVCKLFVNSLSCVRVALAFHMVWSPSLLPAVGQRVTCCSRSLHVESRSLAYSHMHPHTYIYALASIGEESKMERERSFANVPE